MTLSLASHTGLSSLTESVPYVRVPFALWLFLDDTFSFNDRRIHRFRRVQRMVRVLVNLRSECELLCLRHLVVESWSFLG